jgi:hypothetical protein
MNRQPMTARRFAEKVDWEGGIVAALEYGLRPNDIDPADPDGTDLRRLWGSCAPYGSRWSRWRTRLVTCSNALRRTE